MTTKYVILSLCLNDTLNHYAKRDPKTDSIEWVTLNNFPNEFRHEAAAEEFAQAFSLVDYKVVRV